MELLRRGIQDAQRGFKDAAAAVAAGTQRPVGVPNGCHSADSNENDVSDNNNDSTLNNMLKGIMDLRAVLQPVATSPNVVGAFAGGGPGDATHTGIADPNAGSVSGESFKEAWTAYCSTNPRLRDPKALPALVRGGMPEEFRPQVWSHCLGVEKTAVANAVADALGQAAVAHEVALCQSAAVDPPEMTPERPFQDPLAQELTAETADVVTERDGVTPEEFRESPPEKQKLRQAAPVVDLVGGSGYLTPRTLEQIEADVLRTYPLDAAFQESGGPDQLRRVLRSLAAGDTDLGYCQSMNFLAATFIVVLGDEALAHFAVKQLLVKLNTRCWYTDGMKQLRADSLVLDEFIRERLPNVHSAIQHWRFDMLLVTSKWFLCLFSTTLQGEILRRVWDVLLCDGIEAVFRVAVAMLALYSDIIVGARSHDELVFVFQDWQLDVTPEALISAAYNSRIVGAISRAELAQRRRQALAHVSSADTRHNMRNNKFMRGGVRPASMRCYK